MGKLEPAAFESLEHLGHNVVDQVRGRLELFAVEITEEEIRFARSLGWQLLALFLSCLMLTLVVLLVVGMFWDTPHRVQAVLWLTAACGAASGGVWSIYRWQLRHRPVVFSQTIEELRRDALALVPQQRQQQPPPPAPPGTP
jgi:uncharacterized membrane protein YqjE